MRVGHLFRPKIEDLACPWGDVARDAEAVYEGVEVSALCLKIGWLASLQRLAFLAYLRSVFVRSSIGGYVKLVQVDDVSESGDVAGMCFGSCCESWSVSSLKKVSTVGGY